MRRIVLAVIVLFLVGVGTARADTVTFVPGTTNVTTGLTGFSTSGNEMAGMQVTALFANGDSELAIWAVTGGAAGAAPGTAWSLSESGDTFGGIWTLVNARNSGISRLLIDAGFGDAVFDTRALGDIEGTPGSARGWNFERRGGGPAVVDAYYRDTVALLGFPPVGDLFRILDLQFHDAMLGDMTFIADTDSLLYQRDIHPVPEPASLLLLGTGLAGLASRARRKRQ